MDSENFTHAIWAVFIIVATIIISSFVEEIASQATEKQIKYIESDCKRVPILGSAGTHWVCD